MNIIFPSSTQQHSTSQSSSHLTFPEEASGNSSSSSNARIQEVSSRSFQSTSSTFSTIANGQPDGSSWVDSSPHNLLFGRMPVPWAQNSGVVNISPVGASSLSFPQINSFSSASSEMSTFPVSGSQTHHPFFQQAGRTNQIVEEIFTSRGTDPSLFFGLEETPPPTLLPAPSANSCSSSSTRRNSLYAFKSFEKQLEEGKEIIETNGKTLTKKIVLYIFRTFISDFAEQNLSNDSIEGIESNISLSIKLVHKTLVGLGEKNNQFLFNEIEDQLNTDIIPELKYNLYLGMAISLYFERNRKPPYTPPVSANNSASGIDQNNNMSFNLSAARELEGQILPPCDFTEMPDSEAPAYSLDTIFDLEIPTFLPQNQSDLAMSAPPSSSSQKPIRTLESALEDYKAEISKLNTLSSVKKAFHDFLVSSLGLLPFRDEETIKNYMVEAKNETYSSLLKMMSQETGDTEEEFTEPSVWIQGKFADPEITNQINVNDSKIRDLFLYLSTNYDFENAKDFFSETIFVDQSSDNAIDPSTTGGSSSSGLVPSSQSKKRKPLRTKSAPKQSKKNRLTINSSISERKTEELASSAASSNPTEADDVPLELTVQHSSPLIIKFQNELLELKTKTLNEVNKKESLIETNKLNSPDKIKKLRFQRGDVLKRAKTQIKSFVNRFIDEFSGLISKYNKHGIIFLKLSGYVFNLLSKRQRVKKKSKPFIEFINETKIKNRLISKIGESRFEDLLNYFNEIEETIPNRSLNRPKKIDTKTIKIPPILPTEIPSPFIPIDENRILFEEGLLVLNGILKLVLKKAEISINSINNYKSNIKNKVSRLISSIINPSLSLQEDFVGFFKYARKIYKLLEKLERSFRPFESILDPSIPLIKNLYNQLVHEDEPPSQPEQPLPLSQIPSEQ